MQEPFLYIDDLSKAVGPKKPSARAPRGASTGTPSQGKPNVKAPTYGGPAHKKRFDKQKTTANPSAPITTPGKAKPSARAGATPTGGEWEWWSGDGVPSSKLGFELGPEGGWRRRPGSGPGQEAGAEESPGDTPEQSRQQTDPGENYDDNESTTSTQLPEKKLVTSGGRQQPVSSSEKKLEGPDSMPTPASNIENKKQTEAPAKKRKRDADVAADVVKYHKENPEKVKKQFIDGKTYFDHMKDAETFQAEGKAKEAAASLENSERLWDKFKDHPYWTSRPDNLRAARKRFDKVSDAIQKDAAEQGVDIPDWKTEDKVAARKEEQAAAKKRNLTYKKNTKRDPKGTQSSFGYGDKEKPSKKTKTESTKTEAKKPVESKEQLRLDLKEDKKPKAQNDKKPAKASTSSAKKTSSAPKGTDPKRAAVAAENAPILADKKKQAQAASGGGPPDDGGGGGGPPGGGPPGGGPPNKPPKKGPKDTKSKGGKQDGAFSEMYRKFKEGRVPGTRVGEAAAVADAGGHLLSAGVEYGIGGALAAGHHLLKDGRKEAVTKRAPRTAAKKPKSGSEVEQSSMKSLPLYLDLHKAIQMPNAGNTTSDEKTARASHLASYSKRPVGVASEGIVTEDDPDKGKQWKHSDEDSVQAEVDEKLKAKDEDEENEEKSVNKATEFLKSMNANIQREVRSCLPNSLEISFMVDELGYDLLDVSKGLCSITGKDRHKFNEWMHGRLSKSIVSLHKVSGLTND